MSHELMTTWGEANLSTPPYVLSGDEEILNFGQDHSEETFIHSGLYLDEPTGFHLQLIPCPYCGPIGTASVYILMLNPGFGLLDMYAEKTSEELRNELIQQLSGNRRNLFFDPRFFWTGGFEYWLRKFKTIIHQVANEVHISAKEAMQFISREVAFLELVPYHSQRFSLNPVVMHRLRSVKLMKSFVEDVVLKRTENNEATVIVTRKAKDWGLNEDNDIVVYSQHEARGAHISIKTRGGRAICDRLLTRYRAKHELTK
jgi:hypothetical protein